MTYTKTDRTITIILAMYALSLLLYNLNSCNTYEPEPAFVDITDPSPPKDTLSDWDIFYLALVQVESEGNPNAINPTTGASGIAQILPIYVEDANRIIGEDKYTLECRFSPELSREIFEVVQSHYNTDKSIKKAINLHNPKAGSWYERKILLQMEKIKSEQNDNR